MSISPEVGQVIIAALVVISTIVLAALQWRTNRSLETFKGDIQHQVYKLTVDLDQRVQRLYRAQRLLSTYHRSTLTYLTIEKAKSSTVEEVLIKEKLLNRMMSLEFELVALADAIGNRRLKEAVYHLRAVKFDVANESEPMKDDFISAVLPCYRVIAQLLVETTQVNDEQK